MPEYDPIVLRYFAPAPPTPAERYRASRADVEQRVSESRTRQAALQLDRGQQVERLLASVYAGEDDD